jgi:hypothetical protein
MKTHKLLKKLAHFLSQDRSAQRQELKSIREILKKLKLKECHLRDKLELAADADERKEIEGKLEVVHAQRLKGLARVKEIREDQRAQDQKPEKPPSPVEQAASSDP